MTKANFCRHHFYRCS